jgi:hypothetical protein
VSEYTEMSGALAEKQRSLQIQIVLSFAAAIVAGSLGHMVYLMLMPSFDMLVDFEGFMNRMMYATAVSIPFYAAAGILAIIGIVKILQYIKA